jgi:large subunit ribosomal protein L6
MSRLAKKPVAVPSKVEVSTSGNTLTVKGPKATLSRPIHSFIGMEVTPEGVAVTAKNNTRLAKALSGTYVSHLRNMMKGVATPFVTKLILEGVGYRVEVKGKDIVFLVGFSHPVKLAIPEGVTATTEKNLITIEGSDKEVVGQFAANIRRARAIPW